jgi:hypothetical protein
MSTERKGLISTLDALTREILWVRERGRCYVCGMEANDTAHILTRNILSLRWDTHPEGNVHLLCRGCHSEDHAGSGKYIGEFVDIKGSDAYQALVEGKRFSGTISDESLRVLAVKMVDELASVKRADRTSVSK